ncbi:MAG: hypothetical protein ACK5V5_10655 [Cyclobacteriaceae bacterium]|jgi:hypothetical protein|nr:hypothetical protein [Flammeovirgaceae bacterium]
MRLGMLARRVSKTPGEVVAFLASRQIMVDDSANGRLEEACVRLVLETFAPQRLANPAVPLAEQPGQVQTETPTTGEPQPTGLAEKSEEEPGTSVEEMPPLPDVIKAPKVELPGLKVIGKIELPEPRKKEAAGSEEKPSAENDVAERPRPRVDRSRAQRQDRGRPPRKNPVALQREREAREAEERRQQELEDQKRKKTEHYLKRVSQKVNRPTKAARLVQEPTETLADTRPAPTTLLGRFWRWLTS